MNTLGADAFGCGARGYVKDSHVPIFLEATEKFHAYILVRNTGAGSLEWAGQRGYTAKRAAGRPPFWTRQRGIPGRQREGQNFLRNRVPWPPLRMAMRLVGSGTQHIVVWGTDSNARRSPRQRPSSTS